MNLKGLNTFFLDNSLSSMIAERKNEKKKMTPVSQSFLPSWLYSFFVNSLKIYGV